ncbi:hypothetical protein PX52LOC_04269 [Limnoglobus roseus]|uniref:Uncharacterized protein n=2 Tax=Limnoglobus roseus TaxID=2598579 RepID=A0A5C1AH19_9BACT|nr:hypothetical protein PX52LOC_04269 [Limnoglobus roseus]
MLFAAGRASVRPARVWKWATVALVVSQIVTLALWLGPTAEQTPSPTVPAANPPDPNEGPSPPADPYSLFALTRNPNPPAAAAVVLGPSPQSSLTAFSRNFQP